MSDLFARVSELELQPHAWDEDAVRAELLTLPRAVAETPGQQLGVWLVDRARGRAVAVAVWDSEEALDATQAEVERSLDEAARRLGGRLVGVQRYEVLRVRRP